MFSSKKIIFAKNNVYNYGNCDDDGNPPQGLWEYVADPETSGKDIWHPIDPQYADQTVKALIDNWFIYPPPREVQILNEQYIIQLVNANKVPVEGFEISTSLGESQTYIAQFSKNNYLFDKLTDGNLYALRYTSRQLLLNFREADSEPYYGPWSCWYYTEFYPFHKYSSNI